MKLDNFDPEIRFIYTTAEDAVKEFLRRKNFVPKTPLPEATILPDTQGRIPFLLFRQIATANYETERFLQLVDAYDGHAIFCEYHDDIFASQNSLKNSWGKITYVSERGKKGGLKTKIETIIDFNTESGKKIKDIFTKKGESLLDFHHGRLHKEIGNRVPYTLFDASPWFAQHGELAHNYYVDYLAMSIKDVILCENFVMKDPLEAEFTREVIVPAFKLVEEKYGIRPLIVPHLPAEYEHDDIWLFHSQTKGGIQNLL